MLLQVRDKYKKIIKEWRNADAAVHQGSLNGLVSVKMT